MLVGIRFQNAWLLVPLPIFYYPYVCIFPAMTRDPKLVEI